MNHLPLLFALLALLLTPEAVAQTFSGELTSDDETFAEGEFIDTYTVAARSGQTITARLASGAFDTYVIIRSPAGAQVDNDDCTDGDLDHSCATYHAEQDGSYEIWVTSYEVGETGPYRLDVSVEDADPARGSAPLPEGAVRFDGELASGDGQLPTEQFYDAYTLRARAGQQVTVTMTSEAFDTFLIVKTPDGEQRENDDAGGTSRSHVVLTARQTGIYEIIATSYPPGATGSYSIIARVSDGASGQTGVRVEDGSEASGDERFDEGGAGAVSGETVHDKGLLGGTSRNHSTGEGRLRVPERE